MNNVKYVSTQVPITIEHFGVPGMRKGVRKSRALNGDNTEKEPEATKTTTQDDSTLKSHAASATAKPGQAPMNSVNTPKKRTEGKVVSEGDVLDIAKRTPFNVKYHGLSFSDILNSVGDTL